MNKTTLNTLIHNFDIIISWLLSTMKKYFLSFNGGIYYIFLYFTTYLIRYHEKIIQNFCGANLSKKFHYVRISFNVHP